MLTVLVETREAVAAIAAALRPSQCLSLPGPSQILSSCTQAGEKAEEALDALDLFEEPVLVNLGGLQWQWGRSTPS